MTDVHKTHLSFVTEFLLTAASLLLAATTAFGAQIALPSQSGTPGGTLVGSVAFTSQGASVSGVQLDVQYDGSALSLTGALGGQATASGKALYSVNLAPNAKRFLIIGLNQNLISDGSLLNLSITVNPGAPGGAYALALSNVYGTDPRGNPVAIAGSDGTVNVNTTSTVTLQSSGVLNAASFLPGPVAPGELITLTGSGIGPTAVQYPAGSPSATALGSTSVLFDGSPAPLLYASPNQINAIVPFGISGKSITQLTVTSQGQPIAAVAQPVAATAPAIFTIDATGTGAGAILNQDLSVNSPSNAAAKGSAIAIFATGGGQTSPAGVDGQVTGTILPQLLQAATVQIGGLNATVLYAGAAPSLIAGIVQVNAVIPNGVSSGPSIPVVLTIGNISSQAGVTVAIK